MLRPLAFAAFCLAALAGCDSFDDSDYTFQSTTRAYASGDAVTLRLENESSQRIGYNLCFSALEVRQDSEWLDAPSDERACTAQLDIISPRATAEGVVTLPAKLAAGTYRFATRLEVGDRERLARTPSFEVR